MIGTSRVYVMLEKIATEKKDKGPEQGIAVVFLPRFSSLPKQNYSQIIPRGWLQRKAIAQKNLLFLSVIFFLRVQGIEIIPHY